MFHWTSRCVYRTDCALGPCYKWQILIMSKLPLLWILWSLILPFFNAYQNKDFLLTFAKKKIVNLNFICSRVFLSINIGVIVISIISFKAIIFDGVEVKLFQFNGQLNSLTCKVEFMQGQGRCEWRRLLPRSFDPKNHGLA